MNKPFPIRLIASDVDGTLLNSHGTIPEENIAAILVGNCHCKVNLLCTGILGLREDIISEDCLIIGRSIVTLGIGCALIDIVRVGYGRNLGLGLTCDGI